MIFLYHHFGLVLALPLVWLQQGKWKLIIYVTFKNRFSEVGPTLLVVAALQADSGVLRCDLCSWGSLASWKDIRLRIASHPEASWRSLRSDFSADSGSQKKHILDILDTNSSGWALVKHHGRPGEVGSFPLSNECSRSPPVVESQDSPGLVTWQVGRRPCHDQALDAEEYSTYRTSCDVKVLPT